MRGQRACSYVAPLLADLREVHSSHAHAAPVSAVGHHPKLVGTRTRHVNLASQREVARARCAGCHCRRNETVDLLELKPLLLRAFDCLTGHWPTGHLVELVCRCLCILECGLEHS